MSFRIEAIHAFIAVDGDDEEGIIGQRMGDSWLPFIAADIQRLEQLRPIAEAIAEATGQEVRLVRFSVREDLEVIG